MKILNAEQIKQKTKRIAIQILENNQSEKEIILAGINNNGLNFAKNLSYYLKRISDIKITQSNIRLNPAKPLSSPIEFDLKPEEFKNKVIIIVDDVANTGRTIFYAFQPFMHVITKKIEIAVLIDRTHKSFPIKPSYVGLSLATTMKEHIDVQLKDVDEKAVFLV